MSESTFAASFLFTIVAKNFFELHIFSVRFFVDQILLFISGLVATRTLLCVRIFRLALCDSHPHANFACARDARNSRRRICAFSSAPAKIGDNRARHFTQPLM